MGSLVVKFIEWCREHFKLVKILSYSFLALLVITDFFVKRPHIHFFEDKVPGFWALFGFVGCVILIVVSKWLGHAWLMKDEDYYDKILR